MRLSTSIAVTLAVGLVPHVRAQTPLHGALTIHDPSTIIKEGDRYYMYGTGDGIRTKFSFDKIRWFDGPAVFANPPAWTHEAVPDFEETFWAPDIAYFNGKYHLYYSVSTFGQQVSAIGVATNTTLNWLDPSYQWVDQGPVIQSTNGSPFNTIDPAILQESNGNLWMTYGSYWNGIYSIQLNPMTGKRIAANSPTFRLADYNPGIEASYMVERDGDYFLFVNWGSCCVGLNSTYNIRVGRSDSPVGPFLDKNGAPMVNGGGSAFLFRTGRYYGPGHAGIFTEDGQEWFGFHFYDGLNNGRPTYDLRPLTWGADGWPVLGAFPAGDYDGDLDADGADFLAWQRTLGSSNSPADGNDNGVADAPDLDVWRADFAAAVGGPAGDGVPEPPALALALAAWVTVCRQRRPAGRLHSE
jgi:arabinan endo-1,5-alpha-L-arabinosidase